MVSKISDTVVSADGTSSGVGTVSRLDPVARRLAAAGDQQSPSVLEWLEGQQERKVMRRRAAMCSIGGWLLMTTAAIVSSFVAVHMSNDVQEIMKGGFMDPGSGFLVTESGVPLAVIYLPWLLVVVAALLVIGGFISWIVEKIPGFSNTVSAIDWSAASDAVTRLLTIGCTYPEAFRTAAKVAHSKPSRIWLMQAAERVEHGGPDVAPSPRSSGDAAVLELLIDAAESEPHRQWKVAANHFLELARRRLVLLLQSTPMITTIISGLLVWIAISATLGWMWRAVAQLIGGLTYW
jgi:hypothetical protein